MYPLQIVGWVGKGTASEVDSAQYFGGSDSHNKLDLAEMLDFFTMKSELIQLSHMQIVWLTPKPC